MEWFQWLGSSSSTAKYNPTSPSPSPSPGPYAVSDAVASSSQGESDVNKSNNVIDSTRGTKDNNVVSPSSSSASASSTATSSSSSSSVHQNNEEDDPMVAALSLVLSSAVCTLKTSVTISKDASVLSAAFVAGGIMAGVLDAQVVRAMLSRLSPRTRELVSISLTLESASLPVSFRAHMSSLTNNNNDGTDGDTATTTTATATGSNLPSSYSSSSLTRRTKMTTSSSHKSVGERLYASLKKTSNSIPSTTISSSGSQSKDLRHSTDRGPGLGLTPRPGLESDHAMVTDSDVTSSGVKHTVRVGSSTGSSTRSSSTTGSSTANPMGARGRVGTTGVGKRSGGMKGSRSWEGSDIVSTVDLSSVPPPPLLCYPHLPYYPHLYHYPHLPYPHYTTPSSPLLPQLYYPHYTTLPSLSHSSSLPHQPLTHIGAITRRPSHH